MDRWDVPGPATVFFPPDPGRAVVSVSTARPAAVTVRDLTARRVVAGLPERYTSCLAAAPTGELILATRDERVAAWAPATQSERVALSDGFPYQVAVSPDGKRAAAVGSAGGATVWDLGTGRPLPSSADLPDAAREVRFLPGGRQGDVLTADWSRWDSVTGTLMGRTPVRRSALAGRAGPQAVSRDGRWAADAESRPFSLERYLCLGDRAVGRPRWTDTKYQLRLSGVSPAVDPAGRFVVYAGAIVAADDGQGTRRAESLHLLARELLTGRIILREELTWADAPTYLALSDDGGLVAVADSGGQLRTRDAVTGRPAWEFRPPAGVAALAFSPDGMTLAAAAWDARVYLWDVYGVRSWTGPRPDPAAVRRAVADLGSADGAAAFRAARTLHAAPAAEAVAAVAAGAVPLAPPDPADVAGWIAALDRPGFAARARAERELTARAPLVRGAVVRALATNPSPERAARLARVRAAGDRPTEDDRRAARAALDRARSE